MTDYLNGLEDEDLYTLSKNDPLGVLTSTRTVIEEGESVWINREQIEALSDLWLQDTRYQEIASTYWNSQYHFHDNTQRTVNWLLVLDALNFCFWTEKDQPRWTIDYQGQVLDGYWAEAASLKRAVEEGLPLWDAEYLSTISPDTVASIFRGSNTIPLLAQRIEHMHEVGRVLLERYDGQFSHAIAQCEGSAIKLVRLLTSEFSSFYDVATYHGHQVYFFKRAQICVADLYNAFGGQQWGAFTDLEQLTAFADYKLPQVLRHYKVLEYYPALAERIDNQELIESGSEEEIEIRAATIWACELLRRAMLQRHQPTSAVEIDQRLWLTGQSSADMHPYHRTRTIYY